MNKALIIVDVQNDFLPGGALAVPDAHAIIPVINTLQKEFSCIIASMDYHPPNHESFVTQHPGASVGDVIDLHGLTQTLWPVHAVQGSAGASFAADLDIAPIQHVIKKGQNPQIDSYSAFFDNGKRESTGLTDLLKTLRVDHLYVCGLATDYCAFYTAIDAQHEGFNTYFYIDATRGIDIQAGDCERACKTMEEAGITIL